MWVIEKLLCSVLFTRCSYQMFGCSDVGGATIHPVKVSVEIYEKSRTFLRYAIEFGEFLTLRSRQTTKPRTSHSEYLLLVIDSASWVWDADTGTLKWPIVPRSEMTVLTVPYVRCDFTEVVNWLVTVCTVGVVMSVLSGEVRSANWWCPWPASSVRRSWMFGGVSVQSWGQTLQNSQSVDSFFGAWPKLGSLTW